MTRKEILKQVMQLHPAERFAVVEAILKSIDVSETDLDDIWLEEASRRLRLYREGKLEGVPMEEVFP